jgi:hypothetical protein
MNVKPCFHPPLMVLLPIFSTHYKHIHPVGQILQVPGLARIVERLAENILFQQTYSGEILGRCVIVNIHQSVFAQIPLQVVIGDKGLCRIM